MNGRNVIARFNTEVKESARPKVLVAIGIVTDKATVVHGAA